MSWTFTAHAKQRLREMKLTQKQVLEVLNDHEVDYVADESVYGEGVRTAQRGDIAVAYNQDTNSIITVMYRSVEEWSREES